MKLLCNKTTQVEFDNIHASILAVISTIKEEFIKVNGYVAVSANDEAANNFYIVRSTSVPYKLQ